jgi:hypothetical protein
MEISNIFMTRPGAHNKDSGLLIRVVRVPWFLAHGAGPSYCLGGFRKEPWLCL